ATVARALHDAHEHGLVHGGLCPGKILLDPGTEPVLAGFGISAPVLCEPGTAVAGWLSQSQEAIGYLAPELMLGSRALAPAVDVYSLGAILYVLLTGKPPFATAAPAEMLMQILCEEPAAPREHAPKVPAQLEAICLGCLNKERAKRPASALEVAEALEAFRDGKSISIPASTMAEPKARRANRRAPLTAAAAAGVMVAAAISFVIGGVLLTTYLQGERTQAAHDGRLAREELEAARLERSSVQKEKESALDQQQEAKQERDRALQRERLAEAQAEKVRREAQATVARLEQEKTDALRQGQLKAVEDLDRLSRQKAEAERKLAQSEAAQNALRAQLAGARVTASAVNWLAGWQSLWSRPIQAGDQTASRALPPDASGSAGATPSQAGTSPAPSQTPAAPRPLPTDASAKAQALSRPAEPAGPIVPARFSNPEQGSANSQKTPSAPAIKKPEAQVTEEETKRALSQGSAVLTVLLHPDAEMSVNGERAHRVAQHGARRVFITPPLPADGETYYYELNASWVDIDGRRLQRAGVVNVARGRSYVINLRPLQ
ncbi:MAG TPA: protein kinase, partial [Gemmataceae bacterium]|nr:protein kinase [Gemmataceae bacterium]